MPPIDEEEMKWREHSIREHRGLGVLSTPVDEVLKFFETIDPGASITIKIVEESLKTD